MPKAHRVAAPIAVVALCLVIVAVLASSQGSNSAPQTFRATTDLVILDVSVLDKSRHPVRGLTSADFALLDEGQPRPIQTFAEINPPAPTSRPTRWPREVPEEVITNQHTVGRVVVIVIDDNQLRGLRAQEWAIPKARAVAHQIVSDLGPEDMAAVVFTSNNQTSQGLTTDHARLLAAIDNAPTLPHGFSLARPEVGPCFCGVCSIDALTRVSEGLRTIAGLRKAVFYISRGFSLAAGPCSPVLTRAYMAAVRQAQLANVVIYPFDPYGLTVGMRRGAPGPGPGRGVAIDLAPGYLRDLAEATGGAAVVNNNDPDLVVAATLDENRSYYLIGFVPANAERGDGRPRRLEVRVSRPNVVVHTRRGYYPSVVSDGSAAGALAKSPTAGSGGLETAMNGLVAAADIPMRATVVPLAAADGGAVLAVVLSADVPPARLSTLGAQTHVVARVVDQYGAEFGMQKLVLALPPMSGESGRSRMEVMSRLPVAPGRYEVRLGLETVDGQVGSVFVPIDVPDFAHVPLALSGIVLSAAASPPAAPKDAFADLMPVRPTARREFQASDRAMVWFRVYQGGQGALKPANVAFRVVDAEKAVVDEQQSLTAAAFGSMRAADLRFELPLQRLPAGEYLLEVIAAVGPATVRRALRFVVD